MKFEGLILILVACRNCEAISVTGTNEAKLLSVEPVGVTDDSHQEIPEKITLIKADERLGLWRMENGDLVKMVPFVGDTNQEPNPNLVRSFVRKRQDWVGTLAKHTNCDLNEPESKGTKTVISAGRSPSAIEGTRTGKTFWPFSNWFYDYDPYYPLPPQGMPMPYPPMPNMPYPPMPYPPGPMYPPPW